jgi:hypothetical protein
MSHYLVYFYALFSLVLFRFDFILLQFYFLFESFYFNCIFYISGMNIVWKKPWSKRKESGADSEQKYERFGNKI